MVKIKIDPETGEHYIELKEFAHIIDIDKVTHYQVEEWQGKIKIQFFKKLKPIDEI